MIYDDYAIRIIIENIDHILRHRFVGYFVVESKILDEENKISEITIHTHESTKQDAEIVMDDIKTYTENNYNLTIIRNKNIKQDKILDDTYEIKILTMNRYIGGK